MQPDAEFLIRGEDVIERIKVKAGLTEDGIWILMSEIIQLLIVGGFKSSGGESFVFFGDDQRIIRHICGEGLSQRGGDTAGELKAKGDGEESCRKSDERDKKERSSA